MVLTPRLTPKQTQQLAMTPQLRQAIELLQMSSVELQRFVDEEIQKNPLLEVEAEETLDPGSKRDMASTAADEARSFTRSEDRAAHSYSLDGRDFAMENLAGSKGLRDHLQEQLSLMVGSANAIGFARILVHELDDDGYLRSDLAEIAESVGADEALASEALRLLQTCEPTGVAARNLQECFALQLRERGELTEDMVRFLGIMDEIALLPQKARWAEIGIDAETYAELLERVKTLNSSPGSSFDHGGFTEYAIPDVTVVKNNLGGWNVELNRSTLPALVVNRDLVQTVDPKDGDAAKYVSVCEKRADWLLRSIRQRTDTILKVAAEIVRVQDGFFTKGVSHLKPLTMRDVAEKVQINESTVSRVTNSKYLSCRRGTFELKFFFTKAVRASHGSDPVSSASVRAAIRTLVEEEDAKKVLSDDKIARILKERGAEVARRTVTKYREAMNIPSSVERRRLKAQLDNIR